MDSVHRTVLFDRVMGFLAVIKHSSLVFLAEGFEKYGVHMLSPKREKFLQNQKKLLKIY